MQIRRTPATIIIVMLNLLVYFYMFFWLLPHSGEVGVENFRATFGLIPSEFWNGAIWQPVTAIFLHGYLLHLLVTMVGVVSAGILIESVVGSMNFSFLYGISAIAGSLAVAIFQPERTAAATPGATGALFGLMGSMVVAFPNARLLILFMPMRAWIAAAILGIWSLLLVLFDVDSPISYWTLAAGLLSGVIYSRFVLRFGVAGEWKTPFQEYEGFGNPYAHRESRTEAWRRFLELARKKRSVKASSSTVVIQKSDGRVEKVIHPTDEDVKEAKENSSPGSQGPRLMFDPVSGRFIIRD